MQSTVVGGVVSTGRLESFSDGVIAVAITLLVLNLSVPAPGYRHHSLAYNLASNWSSYVAYVISFATIGIIWINHHAAIGRLRQADRAILALNLLLLMSIGVLPFTTNLLARYVGHARGERLAAFLYSASLLVMALAFATLNWHTLFPKSHLLRGGLSEQQRRKILRRSLTGLLPYAIATAIAPLLPYVTFAICGLVAVFYASPAAVPRT
ncbi:MAG: TMEM175 family protein [Solirubrobacteraceae bacterium]